MNKKNATLLGVQTSFTRESLAQMSPRVAHDVVSGDLARAFYDEMKSKIAALYEIQTDGVLAAKYPAYRHQNDCGYDASTFGVQLHVLSREDLKAIIDEETVELRKKHRDELVTVRALHAVSVKKEAQRLLEKASL